MISGKCRAVTPTALGTERREGKPHLTCLTEEVVGKHRESHFLLKSYDSNLAATEVEKRQNMKNSNK